MRLGAVPLTDVNMPNPAIDQIQVVPIREDGVVVGGPWQALVGEGRIGGCELRIAVGRQIDRGEGLVVQACKRTGNATVVTVSSP